MKTNKIVQLNKKKNNKALLHKSVSNSTYYSTIASFYHIRSRERAKYETIIQCSVPV